ncbi:MAG: aminotransferase class I/II-fold pyridoxal phosphate-dependent enzyme [Christensenellales bacterium]
MKKNYQSLLQAAAKYVDDTKMRFHIPGHSGELDGGIWDSCSYDLTEVDGLDNLLNPQGAIADLQRLLAQSYNVKASLVVTTGSTTSILASLGAVAHFGKKVAVLGDMHKSFWNGVMLHDLQAESFDDVEDLKQYLSKTQYVSAICTTSPDYFGRCKDLATLRKIADEYGIKLWVDSAHGAHFTFSKVLPQSADEYSHICVHSMHKTMPCYGGASVLNVSDADMIDIATYYRNMFHTSSPSYLTMSSMEWAVEEFIAHGEEYYNNIVNTIDSFGGRMGQWNIEKTDDPSRLVLYLQDVDAAYTADWLAKHGAVVEMTRLDRMVLIVTPYNYRKLNEFASLLCKAPVKTAEPVQGLSVRHKKATLCGSVEFVDVDMALGKVCASEIGIYPPGLPVIVAGEIFDDETVEFIKAHKTSLFGLVNGRIAVLQ